MGVASERRAEPGLLPSALAAADLGWHVFPCAPGAKRPAFTRNWQDLATTDPDRIRSWWSKAPHQPYNIGIACGPSGLVVVDLDIENTPDARENRLVSGAVSLELLCRLNGQRYPAGTYIVDTPSGGCHLYFTAPATPVRNSAGRAGPLIDIRADGGYVVGAGSRTGEGTYTPRGDFLPLPLPFPSWLARLLSAASAPRPAASVPRQAPASAPPQAAPPQAAPPQSAQPLPPPGTAMGRAYALTALREQTRRVAAARPGTRNDTLNRAAFGLGQLVAAGLLPPLPVMTSLAEAAAYSGLPDQEAHRTIRSGMAAGVKSRASRLHP